MGDPTALPTTDAEQLAVEVPDDTAQDAEATPPVPPEYWKKTVPVTELAEPEIVAVQVVAVPMATLVGTHETVVVVAVSAETLWQLIRTQSESTMKRTLLTMTLMLPYLGFTYESSICTLYPYRFSLAKALGYNLNCQPKGRGLKATEGRMKTSQIS